MGIGSTILTGATKVAGKALPILGVAQVIAGALPLIRDLFSSPTVDQDKIAKVKAARDNAASQMSGELGISYDKAREMVDREFQPMIDQASQPQGGADGATIAEDAAGLGLDAVAGLGMASGRLFKGGSAAANAAKDSSGVIQEAEQGPTSFKGAYDSGSYDTVKGGPMTPAQASSTPPNAGGMRDYPGATDQRGLMVPPGPTGPINGDPVDAETTAALNRIMAARSSAGGTPPPNAGNMASRGFQMPANGTPGPRAIGMEGMTPQLSQLIQEHQDMLAARATQGMRSRMYRNQGD